MTRRDDPGWVPDLVLERYRLGELPEDEARRLERRLGDEAPLRDRLEALGRSDSEIQRQYPPAWLAERVQARRAEADAQNRRPRPAWHQHWLVPAAAAATLLLVLAPRLVGPPSSLSRVQPPVAVESGDRIKGMKPFLELYRRTPEGSERLADGSQAKAGDVIRVGYQAAGSRFGTILSIDGRGSVTLHLPEGGDQAARLEGGTVLLDHAYELDDAPRFERFYFVTGSSPFAVAPVMAAARRVAATPAAVRLALPPSLEQAVFLLRKGDRP